MFGTFRDVVPWDVADPIPKHTAGWTMVDHGVKLLA